MPESVRNLLDVFDGSEIKVEYALYYDEADMEKLEGTVEVETENLDVVIGVDTNFLAELDENDTIKVDGEEKGIDTIVSNTELTVVTDFTEAITAGTDIFKVLDEEIGWDYEEIEYRRDFNPDMPENTRNVYCGLQFRGTKYIRAENSLSLEEEFRGFDEGLYPLANQQGILVKATIVPEEGEAPEDNIRYYTNWATNQPEWSAPDVGEINLTLSGTFDSEEDEEPTKDEDWVNVINGLAENSEE